MAEDLTCQLSEGKLNIRVAFWLTQKEQILVSLFPSGRYSLPGGRVQFGETSVEAIQRELLEEVGYFLEAPQLMAVIENFFPSDGTLFHELLFVYTGDYPLKEHYPKAPNEEQRITWLPFEQFSQIQPNVLHELLVPPFDGEVRHLVNNELDKV